MKMTPAITESLLERGFSRRHLGRISSVMAAGIAGLPIFSEFAQAQQAENRLNNQAGGARNMMDPDAVRITSNENPLGPCKEGLEALMKVAPMGGRYSPTGENADFVKMIAETENVKQEYVSAYPGS